MRWAELHGGFVDVMGQLISVSDSNVLNIWFLFLVSLKFSYIRYQVPMFAVPRSDCNLPSRAYSHVWFRTVSLSSINVFQVSLEFGSNYISCV